MRTSPEMENISRCQRFNISVVINVNIVVPANKTILPGRPKNQDRNDDQEEDDYCAGGDAFIGVFFI